MFTVRARTTKPPRGRRTRAEAQIDALVERRAAAGRDPDEEHDLWQRSVARDRERRRRELRAAWYRFHLDQAERLRRTLTMLIEAHEAAASKLLEDEPKGAA